MTSPRLVATLDAADQDALRITRDELRVAMHPVNPNRLPDGLRLFYRAGERTLTAWLDGGVTDDLMRLFVAAAATLGDHAAWAVARASSATTTALIAALRNELEIARTIVEVEMHDHERAVRSTVDASALW